MHTLSTPKTLDDTQHFFTKKISDNCLWSMSIWNIIWQRPKHQNKTTKRINTRTQNVKHTPFSFPLPLLILLTLELLQQQRQKNKHEKNEIKLNQKAIYELKLFVD